ncbi:hypothetical protein DCAR_0102591 [Daucus carota subsp. sativus]|uniref:Uncharacterized protein n=1 Tax=Daucus carota subsp. sativus TaxID=79200 RepID=A0A169WSF8_DAUCS|nr:PREDICTED: glycine-rich cell wall structural protein-like [Daucus carota subsp. sativus]WOG83416.1 hypothetical protein DCAR_0102591 [Daucus carota subsp. sativus]
MKRLSVVHCCVIFVILLVNGVLANAVVNDDVLESKKDGKATAAEVESSKPRWFGGCGGNGGGPGGGAGGCAGYAGGGGGGYPGGTPGQPGWGGRGGNGGGIGGGAGGAGGYPGGTPGSHGKRPREGHGGRGSRHGGNASGGRGGGGSYSMPNPNGPRCGNIQMAEIAYGYLISYDCGNCNYQYTIDYTGMTTGYATVTCS